MLERLRGTPARAEEAVAGLSEAQLTDTRRHTWSIKIHIGHLSEMDLNEHGSTRGKIVLTTH